MICVSISGAGCAWLKEAPVMLPQGQALKCCLCLPWEPPGLCQGHVAPEAGNR